MRQRPEYDMKLIGSNLKRLRESKKISVEEVRKYLCLGSVQAVYKYEKGISYPPADTMFALMELYEADLEDIIGNHKWRQCANSDECDRLDLIFADVEKRRQFNRLIKFYELYIKYISKATG